MAKVRVILQHASFHERDGGISWDTVILKIGRIKLEWSDCQYYATCRPSRRRRAKAQDCAKRLAQVLKVKVETQEI